LHAGVWILQDFKQAVSFIAAFDHFDHWAAGAKMGGFFYALTFYVVFVIGFNKTIVVAFQQSARIRPVAVGGGFGCYGFIRRKVLFFSQSIVSVVLIAALCAIGAGAFD